MTVALVRSEKLPSLSHRTALFQQLLTPAAGALVSSFVVAVLPIGMVLVMLGILRRPAWQASLATWTATLVAVIITVFSSVGPAFVFLSPFQQCVVPAMIAR